MKNEILDQKFKHKRRNKMKLDFTKNAALIAVTSVILSANVNAEDHVFKLGLSGQNVSYSIDKEKMVLNLIGPSLEYEYIGEFMGNIEVSSFLGKKGKHLHSKLSIGPMIDEIDVILNPYSGAAWEMMSYKDNKIEHSEIFDMDYKEKGIFSSFYIPLGFKINNYFNSNYIYSFLEYDFYPKNRINCSMYLENGKTAKIKYISNGYGFQIGMTLGIINAEKLETGYSERLEIGAVFKYSNCKIKTLEMLGHSVQVEEKFKNKNKSIFLKVMYSF